MSKREFIDRLRAALNGRVPSTSVMDNINYYEEYINTEVRKGKTEEEVLASLGDPRLIAKTIIQTSGQDGSAVQGGGAWGAAYQDASYQDARGYGGSYNASAHGNVGSYNTGGHTHNGNHSSGGYEGGYADEGRHAFRLPVWLVAILSTIAVLVIVSFLVSVLSFLAPVIIIMAAVLFTVKLFRDWLN